MAVVNNLKTIRENSNILILAQNGKPFYQN